MAALLKKKKKKISRNGQGIFHNSGNNRKKAISDALLCLTQPTLRPTNTQTPTKRTLSAYDLCPSHLQPTQVFFSNSHHDECRSYLITQLPKNKKKKFIP